MSKKSNKKYKALIYCRLSKEDGDKVESNSISNQKSYCEDFISKQKDMIVVHDPIVDDGFSGVNTNRDGFKKVEELARKGKINCLVVKDLSRFSRSYIDAGTYLEKVFPSLGVRFIAINDNYDSLTSNSSSDAFVLPFKNLMNESYCKDISVKIRSSKQTNWKNGNYVGSFCPYGYIKDPENKYKLIVDENARANVELIFSLYKDGLSITKIAERLNDLGILSPLEHKQSIGINFDTVFKTSDVAKWGYKTVQRVLKNEVYIGTLAQGKQGTPNYKIKKNQMKDESEWIKVENAHESIISYEDFYNIKEMMKRDTRAILGEDGNDGSPLSGFLFCGDCGGNMLRKTVPSNGKKYVYQVCMNNKNHKICTPHNISLKKLESIVFNAIHRQIELMTNIEQALAEIDNLHYKNDKTFSYDKQIAKLEEEVEKYKMVKVRLYEDFVDGVINKNDYKEFKNMYTERIDDKENTIFRIKKDSQQIIDISSATKSWVSVFKKYENIDKLNRRVMMSLVHSVKIYEKHKVEIVFKYADEYENILEYLKEIENGLDELDKASNF